jgi:hypothetical protein
MAVALVYAAEAYHTRGAMRHVVGDLQMHSAVVKDTTTVMDYWVSMIENWADANKEYEHCSELKVEACLLKMSKYLRRTFHAMKSIYKILSRIPNPGNALKAVKLAPEYSLQPGTDPEIITLDWVSRHRGSKDEIPDFPNNIKPFLQSVGCDKQAANVALSFDCMKSIQSKVMAYNNILVSATAKDAPPIQAIFTLMPNGKQKTKP